MHKIITRVGAETFYDQDYWSEGKHTTSEWTEPMFRKWLGPLISLETVLDYGCGLGYSYQRQLVRSVKHYVGADVSTMALADAQRKGLEGVLINPADGSIPIADSTFDGAVCSEVFEHLFDPLSAARQLNRVLKPGGVLVATVPNFGYHAWRLLAFLRAQVPLEAEDPKKDRFKGVHIRFFSKLMFQRLLTNSGFVDVKIGSFGESSVWDVFQAMGPVATITSFARKSIPSALHLRFLENTWPNVMASRLRAVGRKPG